MIYFQPKKFSKHNRESTEKTDLNFYFLKTMNGYLNEKFIRGLFQTEMKLIITLYAIFALFVISVTSSLKSMK